MAEGALENQMKTVTKNTHIQLMTRSIFLILTEKFPLAQVPSDCKSFHSGISTVSTTVSVLQ